MTGISCVSSASMSTPAVMTAAGFSVSSMLRSLTAGRHTYRSALQGMGFTPAPMLSGLTEFAGRVGASLLLTRVIGERGLFYTDAAAWTFAAVFLAASYYIQLFIIRKKGLTYQNTK